MVQKAVSDAKREWILKVVIEGEEAVKDSKTRWDCMYLQVTSSWWQWQDASEAHCSSEG